MEIEYTVLLLYNTLYPCGITTNKQEFSVEDNTSKWGLKHNYIVLTFKYILQGVVFIIDNKCYTYE